MALSLNVNEYKNMLSKHFLIYFYIKIYTANYPCGILTIL